METDRNPADEGSRRFGKHPAKPAVTDVGLSPPRTLALADLLPLPGRAAGHPRPFSVSGLGLAVQLPISAPSSAAHFVQSGCAALECPRASEPWVSANLGHRPASSGSAPCGQSGCAARERPCASETWVSASRDRLPVPNSSMPCGQSGCAARERPRASETCASANRDRRPVLIRSLHALAPTVPERA